MLITLIKKDKILNFTLPMEIRGNYWIKDKDEHGKEKNPYDTVYQNVKIDKSHILLTNPAQDMENSSNVKYKGTIELNHYIDDANGTKVRGKNAYYWKFNSKNASKIKINISDKTIEEVSNANNRILFIISFVVIIILIILVALVIKT